MNIHFEQPNEVAMLTAILDYQTGQKKLSDQDYKEYQRILKTFRQDKYIHSMDVDMVKKAIENFIVEMDRDVLKQMMDKLA